MEKMNFGQVARRKRKELGLTLEKASELCGMSYKGLEEIELGASDPKLSTVLKISEALELDLDVITN